MRISAFLLLTILLITFSVSLNARIIHVPADSLSIQGGISGAVHGDTVLVATGTYVENIDFIGKAITVLGEYGADSTVIDGGDAGTVVLFASGEGPGSVLDGFTLTNGSGYLCNFQGYYGGGVFCDDSSPTIRNCLIDDNRADGLFGPGSGGGIACFNGSSPMIADNIITNNRAEGISSARGGGIYCTDSSPTIARNTISQNSSLVTGSQGNGGGIACDSEASPLILGNTITMNSTLYSGGGIYSEDAAPVISGNVISGNYTDPNPYTKGGGIYVAIFYILQSSFISGNIIEDCDAASGGGIYGHGITSWTVSGNTVLNNRSFGTTASAGGGGVYLNNASPDFDLNLVAGNSAQNDGGGLYCTFKSYPYIVNNTFHGNTAVNRGGGLNCFNDTQPVVINTIFWGDSAPTGPEINLSSPAQPSNLFISYSDVEGGQSSVNVDSGCQLHWLNGMIDADPIFADPGEPDYNLRSGSPCIYSGDPAYDAPRGGACVVDMGAIEYWQGISCRKRNPAGSMTVP